MKMAAEIVNGEKVIGRPKALYAEYPRKGGAAPTAPPTTALAAGMEFCTSLLPKQ